IFEGEIVGMILGAELLRREGKVRAAVINVDNQAAIRATHSFDTTPAHYLMDRFHETLLSALTVQDSNTIPIRWTPGHVGIEGNEAADAEAKEAARGLTSETKSLPITLR
ncbi:uncharacterized protein HD556DRAFT_1192796, partial [Suillus plorans]